MDSKYFSDKGPFYPFSEIENLQKQRASETNKESQTEKLFCNLLKKDKFFLNPTFDEENSKIFLQELNEGLETVHLDDTLPEDYKIITECQLYIPPTKKSKKLNKSNKSCEISNINFNYISNSGNVIHFSDPFNVSFRSQNKNSEISHRTIEWKIESQFSFRFHKEQ